MEELVVYISEGVASDKHSKDSLGLLSSIHGSRQLAGFKQADCPQHGAAITGVGIGEKLLTASPHRAIINVYSWGKETPDQVMAVPEKMTCLAIAKHPSGADKYKVPNFRTPWLLAGGTEKGRIYVWELASGNLLCVKDAHYQAVSVLRFSRGGGFLVSGGRDARCVVWNIIDLVSVYNNGSNSDGMGFKAFASFADHVLPINDIIISEAGVLNDLRIYTASNDGTLRIYDVMTQQLLTTFVLSHPVECIAEDPAKRACYVGLNNGTIRIIHFYRVNKSTAVLENVIGCGKISPVEHDPELQDTFVHHQLQQGANLARPSETASVKRLALSLDGSCIISGDTAGRVYVSDVVTKQIIKSLTTLNAPISFIEVNIYPNALFKESEEYSIKADKRHRLIPPLKRILVSEDAMTHQLYMEIPGTITEKPDFNQWLEAKAQEEMEFKNLSEIDSEVKVAHTGLSNVSSDQDDKLAKVSKAYSELRDKYEQLYQEHIKNLN